MVNSLDYTALVKSLERRVVSPVYLFYGEETYLREKILERFKDLVSEEVRDFNMDVLDGREKPLEEILGVAVTLPFMTERRLVFVRNADFFKSRRKKGEKDGGKEPAEGETENLQGVEEPVDDKTTSGEEALLAYLQEPPNSTCLIFITDSVDKKRKTYKAIEKKGQVVEFAPLKGPELNEWVDLRARKLGKVIEPAAAAGLITAVGNDLQQLNSELEKLSCFSQTERITPSDVGLMVSRTAELNIFEMIDAIGGRDYKKAIRMAREMVFLGEPVLRLLFMIARQFRLIITAKSLLEEGNMEKHVVEQLKIHPFAAQKCLKQARNFTLSELVSAMDKILATDAKIKGGKQEPVLALELLIIALCEK